MLFNSFEYIVLLSFVTLVYYVLPKYRWVLLLLASYAFYISWNFNFIFLILLSTLVDYTAARKIQYARNGNIKRVWLYVSLSLNLGLLGFFKYFNFVIESLSQLFSWFCIDAHPEPVNILLPVGISFYTFQTISYTIDVYRGNIKAEKNLGKFALYVAFFPQLVAGPIERSKNLIPQFNDSIPLRYENLIAGARRLLWGYFKKIVVADNIALTIGQVFNTPEEYHGLSLVLGSFLFVVQIFADFSGYSDIAIGSARLLGIRLSNNFHNNPFFVHSYIELWRRWHITLMQWFRDYLYRPLVRERNLSRNSAIFIVFLVTGLWHGARWTFVLWGAIHGAILIINYMYVQIKINTGRTIKYHPIISRSINMTRPLFVFMIFAAPTFLFVARDLPHAAEIINQMINWSWRINLYNKPATLMALFIFIFISKIIGDSRFEDFIEKQTGLKRLGIYLILMYAIFLLGNFNANEFYYFQF